MHGEWNQSSERRSGVGERCRPSRARDAEELPRRERRDNGEQRRQRPIPGEQYPYPEWRRDDGKENAARELGHALSDFHDLGLFGLDHAVHLVDVIVVQLLQILLGVLHVVLAHAIQLL